MKKLLVFLVVFVFLVTLVYLTKSTAVVTSKVLPVSDKIREIKSEEIIAENLDIPWEVVFGFNDDMYITERPRNLLHIGKDRKVIKVSGVVHIVVHIDEGGLLGMALHPKFVENHFS